MNDPIETSEIMELMKANYVDIDDPKRYQMIMDIVEYFSGRDDKRETILEILSGKSGDRVDILWDWVQLTRERDSRIRGLPKELFTGDIQKEIENEYLTRDNIKILKSQLKERLIVEKNKGDLIQERKDDDKYSKKVQRATEKALDISELQNIQKKINEIEQINKRLEKY